MTPLRICNTCHDWESTYNLHEQSNCDAVWWENLVGQVWQIDSFWACGEWKYGELTDQPNSMYRGITVTLITSENDMLTTCSILTLSPR